MRRVRALAVRDAADREERRLAHEDAVLASAPGHLRDAVWSDGFGEDGRSWAMLVSGGGHGTERQAPAVAYGNARLRMVNGAHIDLVGVRRGSRGEVVWP